MNRQIEELKAAAERVVKQTINYPPVTYQLAEGVLALLALRSHPLPVELPTHEGLWWLNWKQLWRVSRFDAERFTGHVIHPPCVKTVGYELPPGHWLEVTMPPKLEGGGGK